MKDLIIKLITEKYGDLGIFSIYKTGSQLICNNCNDYDYKIIVENNECDVRSFFNGKHRINVIIYSKEYYEKLLNFEIITRHTIYLIENLFKPNNTIYGDRTNEIKLLENADKYKQCVIQNFNKFIANEKSLVCNKHLWWIIWSLMMIENNSYEITDEMLDIANKCHNYELPKAWEEWVKEKIY